MKPDRSNIEAWLLDRLEGRLTPEQERELQAFLLVHPDIAAELGELPSLENERVTFTGKDLLKRSIPPNGAINATNLDDFLVARIEGDLPPEKKSELDRYIAQHPEAAKAARQMAAAHITSDGALFTEKRSLMRGFPPQGMPDRHRLDDFLVAYLEGDLNEEQSAVLTTLLNVDAQAAKSWALMQRARISAPSVVFTGKTWLKRREEKVIPLWSRSAFRYAAAASIALLFGLWWMVKREKPEERFANDKPVKEVQENAGKKEREEREAVKDGAVKDGAVKDEMEVNQPDGPVSPDAQPSLEKKNGDHRDQKAPTSPPQRDLPSRLDRLDPLLASHGDRDTPQPLGAVVPQVPISRDAPVEVAAVNTQAMTIGQMLASAVRTEVLDQPQTASRSLDGNDALALADKGLHAIAGDNAGVSVERSTHRRRFKLHLGEGLALTASTSR